MRNNSVSYALRITHYAQKTKRRPDRLLSLQSIRRDAVVPFVRRPSLSLLRGATDARDLLPRNAYPAPGTHPKVGSDTPLHRRDAVRPRRRAVLWLNCQTVNKSNKQTPQCKAPFTDRARSLLCHCLYKLPGDKVSNSVPSSAKRSEPNAKVCTLWAGTDGANTFSTPSLKSI